MNEIKFTSNVVLIDKLKSLRLGQFFIEKYIDKKTTDYIRKECSLLGRNCLYIYRVKKIKRYNYEKGLTGICFFVKVQMMLR